MLGGRGEDQQRSTGIAILRRVSHFIPFDTRVNMYNALVMPYFNYCSAVWGNINKCVENYSVIANVIGLFWRFFFVQLFKLGTKV